MKEEMIAVRSHLANGKAHVINLKEQAEMIS